MNKNMLRVLTLVLIFVVSFSILGSAETLRIASKNYCAGLDPAYMQNNHVQMPIYKSIFNGLVKYEVGSFKVVPDLAKSWDISEEGTEITFHLREGVQFHKGYGEFTAKDVKFSFERIINDEACPSKSSFSYLERVEIVDNYTVKLILEKPMAQLFSATLPFNAGLILSKKALEDMSKDQHAQNPVGTGPYKFDNWVPEEKIVLTRNTNYWDEDAFVKGAPDTVEFIPMEDAFARGAALKSGELDLGEISLELVDKYKSDDGVSAEVLSDLAYWWVSFTVDKSPMDNKDLREALRYIIDPDQIIAGAFAGFAERANSMMLPSMVGYWEDAPSYDVEDVGREKVEQLLSDAGYPNGEGLELTFLTGKSDVRRNAAQIIQAQLAEYGIELKIDVLEMGALVDAACAGDYHLHIGRYSMTPSPLYCSQWFKSEQKWNFMQYKNEEYDRLWSEASSTLDQEKRGELIVEMQKVMDEDAPAVWVCHGSRAWGLSDRVSEAVIQPDSYTVVPWKTKMK